jgi:hypothetical protein
MKEISVFSFYGVEFCKSDSGNVISIIDKFVKCYSSDLRIDYIPEIGNNKVRNVKLKTMINLKNAVA